MEPEKMNQSEQLQESKPKPAKKTSASTKKKNIPAPTFTIKDGMSKDRKPVQITFKEGQFIGFKSEVDQFLLLCNQREAGPAIGYVHLFNYAFKKLDENDIAELQGMYQDDEFSIHDRFKNLYGRKPKKKELFQWINSMLKQ